VQIFNEDGTKLLSPRSDPDTRLDATGDPS
jgi:hypothetical protein